MDVNNDIEFNRILNRPVLNELIVNLDKTKETDLKRPAESSTFVSIEQSNGLQ